MVVRILLLFSTFLFLSFPAFAKVSATVDRAVLEEGETLVLTIRSDDESPELEVLEQFFNVLGTSRSSKMSFVNGRVSSEKEWLVTLSPKKMGVSVIPSIKIGNEKTPPIRIQVVKPKVLNASQGADIFLEVSLDTNSAYVQSEVIYIARLYRAVEIREATLTEPEINSAVVERMGEDVTFQTTRNQRRYQVTERRFALFPQQSGDLVIPPTLFEAQVPVSRQPQRQSNDPFDRFFQSQQRMKRVKVQSDSLTLEVLPQPASFSGSNWLPAKRVVLTESWSVEPPVFKVGEPITRTLKLEAVGQTGAQLPEFEEFPAHGIKQYADQPSVQTGLAEGSLAGVREEKFAIIPTSSGKLVLPEVRLPWWDTELDKEQVVIVPPRVIEVSPAEVGVNQTKAIEDETETEEILQKEQAAVTKVEVVESPGNWPLIALALGLGWLLTIIVWVIQLKKRPKDYKNSKFVTKSNDLTLNESKKQLKKACDSNNPNEAKSALLAWANAAWPEKRTNSLLNVGERLHNSKALDAVIGLDQALYSNLSEEWNGEKFWSDVGQSLKKPRKNSSSKLKSLPDLYPG